MTQSSTSQTTSSDAEVRDTGAHEMMGPGASRAALSAKGTLVSVEPGKIIWRPLDTSYEHHLEFSGHLSAEVGRHLSGRIRVRARKVYAVSSGGNFVQPILGTPRIIQGRILALEGNTLFVKAGAVFAIELPTEKDTIDLGAGSLAVSAMVNVVAWPGAAFEAA